MKIKFSSLLLPAAFGVLFFTHALISQTSVQIFSAVNTRLSPSTTSYQAPSAFNTTTLNLTCNTAPIVAMLSGPLMISGGSMPDLDPSGALQAGGNLLVDNNLLVTVTPTSTGTAGPATNVCTGINQGSTYCPNGPSSCQSVDPNLQENCFTSGYAGPATSGIYPPGALNGKDPDTFLVGGQTVDAAGGVPPINIGPLLVSGQQNVTIALTDEGGILTGSSMFLTTNCIQGGVTGPATISGNPITSGATGTGLTQTFNFNTGNNQVVGFVYDLSGANAIGSLGDDKDGAIPQTADTQLDPATYQSAFVPGTSFATSNCLVHTGELLPNGHPACKLYTLECTSATDSTAAGKNCPVSTVDNEVVKDLFDGPPFSLPNIYTPYGTFHAGIGFLMASEDWSASNGGPCTFDSGSGFVANLPCPQNLLTSFSGPGAFASTGDTDNPNSTFISIYGVPEDRTSVNIEGQKQNYWVNTTNLKVFFVSTPPNLSGGAQILVNGQLRPLPGTANFEPAPIKSITYGVSDASSMPLPVNEPINGDNTLASATCPTTLPTSKTEPTFAPPGQTLQLFSGEGQYLLHYYAQDCAGTQELLFTEDPSGIWSTNFYTIPINVDLTPPVAVINSPTPAQSFKKGTTMYGSFHCTDALNGAGVTHCGSNSFATGSTYDTGPLSIKLNTSSVGSQTLSIVAADGAGNSTTTSVSYTVTK